MSGKIEVEGNSCVFVCSDVTPVCRESLPECLCGLAYIESITFTALNSINQMSGGTI